MGILLGLKTAPQNRAALIDELGDLSARRDAWIASKVEKRYQQVLAEAKTWYAGKDALELFVEKGARYQLNVSPCAKATVFSARAIYTRLKLNKFLAVVSVTAKALAEIGKLTPDEIAALGTTERTGPRGYTTTPLTLAPAAPRPDAKSVSDLLLDGTA
jgi:hypothetical protein